MNRFSSNLIVPGKKIDVHTHIGLNAWKYTKFSPDSITTLNDLMSQAKNFVDIVVVLPEVTTLYYHPRILVKTLELVPSGICDFPYHIENEYVLAVCKNIPECLPFLNFSPIERIDEQIQWIKKQTENVPFLGLKLHSLAAHCCLADVKERADKLLDFAAEACIPVLLHGEVRYPEHFNISDLKDLLDKYENINFCIAHLCMFSQEFFELFTEQRPNLYTDMSPFYRLCHAAYVGEYPKQRIQSLNYDDPLAVFHRYYSVNPEHVLFGTDYPYCPEGYQKEASFLDLLDENIRLQISSVNTIRYLSYA